MAKFTVKLDRWVKIEGIIEVSANNADEARNTALDRADDAEWDGTEEGKPIETVSVVDDAGRPVWERRSMTRDDVLRCGYVDARRLDDGRWLAVQQMITTGGLFVVENEWTWRTRWCYGTVREAIAAMQAWDGAGDPPGLWIKQKPEERLGPGALNARDSQ